MRGVGARSDTVGTTLRPGALQAVASSALGGPERAATDAHHTFNGIACWRRFRGVSGDLSHQL
eukprot:6785506-Alexandrium_andersonii.AAC.1